MNALEINRFIDLTVEYQMNGSRIKRNVKAGKVDNYGKNWLLVETEDETGQANRQWIDMNFFKKWLGQVDQAA